MHAEARVEGPHARDGLVVVAQQVEAHEGGVAVAVAAIVVARADVATVWRKSASISP